MIVILAENLNMSIIFVKWIVKIVIGIIESPEVWGTIIVFAIGYYLIDKKIVKKEENKKKLFNLMLKETYTSLNNTLNDYLSNEYNIKLLRKNLKKWKFEELNMYRLTFKYDSYIMEFSKEGFEFEKVKEYLRIKTEFYMIIQEICITSNYNKIKEKVDKCKELIPKYE